MRIGVDLGGTKIEAIALADDGSVRARKRVATPRDDYRETLEAIARLVVGIEKEVGAPGSVGIGIPGALSPATGRVKNANSVWLNGRALDKDLERRLERPLRFANDANCFALSEATDGAAADVAVAFGAILGTGCGGGIVVNGRILTGPNAIAGEWGHNPLPWPAADEWPGPSCYCRLTGCLETFLSGPGLARDYGQAAGAPGESVTVPVILARAEAGDPVAESALARYEDRLARALCSLINILDPDVIVLGGGLSNLSRLYRNVPKHFSRYGFSDRFDTRLLPPRHGDSSGVRGAAWLWGPGEEPKSR
jgi:fructokinase